MEPTNNYSSNTETNELNFNQPPKSKSKSVIIKEELISQTNNIFNSNEDELTQPTKSSSLKNKTVTIVIDDEKEIKNRIDRRTIRKVKSSELALNNINKITNFQSKPLDQESQFNLEFSKSYPPPLIPNLNITRPEYEKKDLLLNISPKQPKKKKYRIPSILIDIKKFPENEDEINLKLQDDRSLLINFQNSTKESPKLPNSKISPIPNRKKKGSGNSGSLSPTETFIWSKFEDTSDKITHSSRSNPLLNRDNIFPKNIQTDFDEEPSDSKSFSRTPPTDKRPSASERTKSGINRSRFKSDEKLIKRGRNLKSLSNLSKNSFVFEKKSPNLREGTVDINSLKCLTGFEAMLLDKDCRKYIKTHWKTADKPTISSQIIDENGLKFCKEKLDEEIKKGVTIESWFTLNARANTLILSIQESAVLIAPIHERLEIIRSILLSFLRGKTTHKTVFIEKLFHSINEFIDLNTFVLVEQKLEESTNLHKLLEASHTTDEVKLHSKEFEKNKMKETHKHLKEDNKKIAHKVLKIILLAFGDDSDAVSKVLGALKNWEDSDGITKLLKTKFFEWSLTDIQARNVSNIEHEWAEQVSYDKGLHLPPPIDDISISDCIRCLMFDGVILKKLIKVNNKVFYNEENQTKFSSDEEFYINLFLTLYFEENNFSESLFNFYDQVFIYDKSSEPHLLLDEKQIGRVKEIKSGIENKLSKMKKKSFSDKLKAILKIILKDKKLSIKSKIDIILEFTEKEILTISYIMEKIIKPILMDEYTITIDGTTLKVVLDIFKHQKNLTLPFILTQIVMPVLCLSDITMAEKVEIILSQFEEDTSIRYERVMKLMTMSCWNRGDMYFRLSFTKLHKFPAFCFIKLEQGIESFVTIDNVHFSVTEVKNYGVYPRIYPDKKDDFPLVNFERKLALLPVAWTVKSPLEGKWIANLRILQEWKINEEIATAEEATYIKNALNDFTSIISLNKEYPKSFVGLKRNYRNTFALNREDNTEI